MNKKLLVIDDEKSVRKSFELTFEDSDYNIETAESGKKGIERIKENTYELIFLDLKMPEMNGVETLKEIRKINTKVRVYIITAFLSEYLDELKEATSQDNLDFEIMHKPLDSEQLTKIVNQILSEKSQLKRNYA